MINYARLKAAALSLMIFSSPLFAEEISVETARGAVSVTKIPKTIAVFDIPAVDTLHALGVPIAGTVGKMYVDYLDDVTDSAKVVGSLFDPDFKALSIMQPDLIIVGGRSSTSIDKVSKIAPAIDMTITGDALLDLTRQRLKTYGELFDKEEKAKSLTAELDEAIKAAQEAVAGKGNGLIIMTNGAKLSAFGVGSRFGWIYPALNLPASTDDITVANHGDSVSFEFILQQNPDWLLVVDRGQAIGQEGNSANQTLDNEIIHKTKAWKNKQIVYLNSADIYISSGGIQSQLRTLKHITKLFNKEK
ncbi:siderophore ABC transporter substrate-binding protein [Leucothrix arctica]|uniref:Iron ABC transporter substrate-binding protein n=1 Tax=Leucothrix arctica TaxID=1481894 RepID=A0A317C9F7_9GAMM|nr:siderophore ABC transporter substrate-binding protein [Leucothrix arctica]PWQ95168.1 iron ABC transporter substrate-binding protein [Leucothrix arctica]